MLTLAYGENYPDPAVLLLGGFDGLHKGHATLLSCAKQYSLPVGIMTIVGGKAGGDLFTLAERERIFAEAGLDFTIAMRFSEIKERKAEEFLNGLFSSLDLKAVVCGEDFRFGYGAAGDIELLKKLSPCPVRVLPIKRSNGEKIATSRTKEFLAKGEIAAANALLEGRYFTEGFVGKRVASNGNITQYAVQISKEKYLPADGFYAGSFIHNGERRRGVLGCCDGNTSVFAENPCVLLQGDKLTVYPMYRLKTPDFTDKFDIFEYLHSTMRDIKEDFYD